MFPYWPKGDILAVTNIDRVTSEELEGWHGHLMVSNYAMLFTKPSFKVKSRYFEKDSPYCKFHVRYERRLRLTYRVAVQSQCETHHHLLPNSRANVLVQ